MSNDRRWPDEPMSLPLLYACEAVSWVLPFACFTVAAACTPAWNGSILSGAFWGFLVAGCVALYFRLGGRP